VEQVQVYGNVANWGILWRANDQHLDPDYPSTTSLPMAGAVGIRANF
jgi:hypothetical protein